MKFRLPTFLSTCLVLLILASCNGGGGPATLPVVERGTSLMTWVVEGGSLAGRVRNWVKSDSTLELGILLSYSLGPSTKPANVDAISKFELDFGDGNGWQDVTAEASNWDYGDIGREIDVSRMTRHTYSEPGEYTIRGRITYWDGEVFTTAGFPDYPSTNSDLLVTILPEGSLAQ